MGETAILLVMGLALAAMIAASVRTVRRDRRAKNLVAQLQAEHNPLFVYYPYGDRCQITQINGARGRWTPYALEVTPDAITIYDVQPVLSRRFVLDPVDLRWFGRPQKYSSGINELWLHAEIAGEWWRITLRMSRTKMQELIRAMKVIATEEQNTAYRRRRPYIHAGPLPAQPAHQDMLGAWALDDAVSLYLTPLHLVVLRGTAIQRVIPLESIQNVTAIKRLDRPREPGLVRFDAGEEHVAFALPDYRAFAEQLAEAARRTLEDPVQWQRKKKKDDDEDWDDDDDTFFDDEDDALLALASAAHDDEAARSGRIRG